MENKSCPFCGKGKLARAKKTILFDYKGHSIELEQPGEYCDSCDEGIINGSDLKATEKELHDFRAKIDDLLTTDEVRRIRTKLGLTQHQAAEIFGGGPNAFSRYERGEVRQTKALDQLLRLLDRHPEQLDELTRSNAEAA
jgi:HTH-type transcriptional regulator/antitoxin MqsA